MKNKNISIHTGRSVRQTILASAAAGGVLLANDRGSDNTPGEYYMANSSRFVEANFSEPLTQYALGWRDSGKLEQLLEFLAPRVPTTRRFEFAQAVNSDSFLSETDDIRAVGGDFKRVEYTSTKATSTTLNKGLTIRVDMDNVTEQPGWRELYTSRLMKRCLRNEARRAYALLSAAATTNTAKTWDTTAAKDPDQDVMTQVIAFGDAVGLNPNRAVYGVTAWNKRRTSHRAQATAGGFAAAGMTPSEVAVYLGLDDLFVSNERYALTLTTKGTVATTNLILLYLAESGMTNEDPSSIKRFVSPTMGGTPFRVYEQQINAKLFDITVEYYSQIVVTSTLGLQKLTIS